MLEELVNSGRLRGTVVGGRQDKAVFVPDIYSRTQSTWVDSFFRQNGYLGNYFLFSLKLKLLILHMSSESIVLVLGVHILLLAADYKVSL